MSSPPKSSKKGISMNLKFRLAWLQRLSFGALSHTWRGPRISSVSTPPWAVVPRCDAWGFCDLCLPAYRSYGSVPRFWLYPQLFQYAFLGSCSTWVETAPEWHVQSLVAFLIGRAPCRHSAWHVFVGRCSILCFGWIFLCGTILVAFEYAFLGSLSTWVLSACPLQCHVQSLVAFFLGTHSTLCCCIKYQYSAWTVRLQVHLFAWILGRCLRYLLAYLVLLRGTYSVC